MHMCCWQGRFLPSRSRAFDENLQVHPVRVQKRG